MFSHVMVGSNDIERSKRFYDAVLGLLGAGEPLRNVSGSGHVRLFYPHDGSMFCVTQPINGEPACHANGGTVGTARTPISPDQGWWADFRDPAGTLLGLTTMNPPA